MVGHLKVVLVYEEIPASVWAWMRASERNGKSLSELAPNSVASSSVTIYQVGHYQELG